MPTGGQKRKRPSKRARDRQRRRVEDAVNEAVPELQAAPAVLDESVPPTPIVHVPGHCDYPSSSGILAFLFQPHRWTNSPFPRYLPRHSPPRHPGYFSNSGPTRASGYSPNSLIQPPVQELPPPATGFVCAPLPPLKLASGPIDRSGIYDDTQPRPSVITVPSTTGKYLITCPTSTRRSNPVFQGPVVTTASPIAGPSGLYNYLVPHTPEGPLPPPGKWYEHTAPPTTPEGFAVPAAASSSGDSLSLAADGTPESFSSSLTSFLTPPPPKRGRVDQPSSYPRRNLGF
ncbi:leucine-rich repeat extensin-like protein 3 [Belonocnema kinseyi]|uniref:leucine-rich repeat extensin-like protein 3 n=1 Tax=Belonocnema kinseyi TaxID=2817044 RepID=UPI00143DF191|nr:leucine-rich repeat extensin-like protein 3 [Belonocnema kinseyi]